MGAGSSTAALVIRSRAGGAVTPPDLPPMLHGALVVFENIDLASAVDCLGPLLWCSIVRRGDLIALTHLRGDTARLHSRLAQACRSSL